MSRLKKKPENMSKAELVELVKRQRKEIKRLKECYEKVLQAQEAGSESLGSTLLGGRADG